MLFCWKPVIAWADVVSMPVLGGKAVAQYNFISCFGSSLKSSPLDKGTRNMTKGFLTATGKHSQKENLYLRCH